MIVTIKIKLVLSIILNWKFIFSFMIDNFIKFEYNPYYNNY